MISDCTRQDEDTKRGIISGFGVHHSKAYSYVYHFTYNDVCIRLHKASQKILCPQTKHTKINDFSIQYCFIKLCPTFVIKWSLK